MLLGFVAVLLLSKRASSDYEYQKCKNESITLRSEWTLPYQYLTENQNCTYKFQIKNTSFYFVNFNVFGIREPSTYSVSNAYSETIRKDFTDDSKQFLIPPPLLEINLQFGHPEDSSGFEIVSLTVTEEKLNAFSKKQILDASEESVFLPLEQMEENITYIFKSKTKVRLYLLSHTKLSRLVTYLSWYFVFNGSSLSSPLIGTLYGLLESKYLESKSISVYVAKKTFCDSRCLVPSTIVAYDQSAFDGYVSVEFNQITPSSPSEVRKEDLEVAGLRPCVMFMNATTGKAATTIVSTNYNYYKSKYCPVTIRELKFSDENATLSIYAGEFNNEFMEDRLLTQYSSGSNRIPQYFEGFLRTLVLDKGEVMILLDDGDCKIYTPLTVTPGWEGFIGTNFQSPEVIPSFQTFVTFTETSSPLNFTFSWNLQETLFDDSMLTITSLQNNVNVTKIFFPDGLWEDISVVSTSVNVTLAGNAKFFVRVTTTSSGNLDGNR